MVKCQEDGNWDFGDLRCEGPVCEDPRRPPDGIQISESYEQGSEVKFECNKEGYIPINPAPITCTEAPDCKIIAPLGITSGVIPDSGMFGILFLIMRYSKNLFRSLLNKKVHLFDLIFTINWLNINF